MDYHLTWVVGRFAGSLADYRQAYHDAAGEYNEREGTGRGSLLSTISFASVPPGKRAAADSNIRMCRYFVLVAEASWDSPPASFRPDYKLALACRADPELPLQEVVAMFRKRSAHEDADDPDEGARLNTFRNALDAGVRQFDFADVTEFRAQIAGLFSAWMDSSE